MNLGLSIPDGVRGLYINRFQLSVLTKEMASTITTDVVGWDMCFNPWVEIVTGALRNHHNIETACEIKCLKT